MSSTEIVYKCWWQQENVISLYDARSVISSVTGCSARTAREGVDRISNHERQTNVARWPCLPDTKSYNRRPTQQTDIKHLDLHFCCAFQYTGDTKFPYRKKCGTSAEVRICCTTIQNIVVKQTCNRWIMLKVRQGNRKFRYSIGQILSGGLKTRDRKTRHGQNCRTGKRKTAWKTRHQTAELENARKGMYGKPNCVFHM